VVVIQEIFGVNHHIRAVCDRLAAEGYAAVAPALFDRQVKDFQSGYTPDEIAEARKFVANPDWGAMLRDTQAAIDELKSTGPVGIVGFCMGGTVAFLAACRLNGLSAAVCYYGGQIAKNADEKPKVPTLMHFGAQDASIPMSDVEIIKKKRGGDCEIHVYPGAAHGFHCDERGSFHEASAKVAWQRTTEFLKKHMKK
jgi:carboxymethylenebutenolidase